LTLRERSLSLSLEVIAHTGNWFPKTPMLPFDRLKLSIHPHNLVGALRYFTDKYKNKNNRPRPMKGATMKSSPSATYRSVAPNDTTADSRAAVIDTDTAGTDDQEENEEREEDRVGDDHSKNTSDEEYIDVYASDDDSDDSGDEEDEDKRRAVDEDQEEEEEEDEQEQEGGNADEDRIDSSDTGVYLGHAGIGYPGSREYRNTVQRLANKHGFHWSDNFFNRLKEKHTPNAFWIVDPVNSRWRKASANELQFSVKQTLSKYRAKDRAGGGGGAFRAGGGKQKKTVAAALR
jgi:hypothetical protein